MVVSGSGGQTASPAYVSSPRNPGLPPSSSPSQLPNLRPLTHIRSRDPWPNRFPEILLFSCQPLAELISCWHLGIMSTTDLILAHFDFGSFSYSCVGFPHPRLESRKGSRTILQSVPRQSQWQRNDLKYFNCFSGVDYTWALPSGVWIYCRVTQEVQNCCFVFCE